MKENYYKKFINFLKEHNLYDENAMEYLHQNGIFFDYSEEKDRDFIGCRFATNKRKILKCIILCVPNIRDEKTLIINIHEYTHALLYYKYLGKKVYVSKGLGTHTFHIRVFDRAEVLMIRINKM